LIDGFLFILYKYVYRQALVLVDWTSGPLYVVVCSHRVYLHVNYISYYLKQV